VPSIVVTKLPPPSLVTSLFINLRPLVAIVPLGYLVIVVVVTVLVKVAVTVWVKNDRLHVLIVASLMSIEHGPHDGV
jgi:hypothetical protein